MACTRIYRPMGRFYEMLVLSALVGCLVPGVISDGFVEVRFISYSNDAGKGNNGHCCDGRAFFCQSRGCDHYFEMCLDRISNNDDVSSCAVGTLVTGVTHNQDRIEFGRSIGGTPNPYRKHFTRWPGGMKIKVNVWDDDRGFNKRDYVDYLTAVVRRRPGVDNQSPVKVLVTLRARTTLIVEVTLYCLHNWHDADCGTFCSPRDAPDGHYDCDRATGQKICHEGWDGDDCNHDINDCAHNPCLHGATCVDGLNEYMCICQNGYEGARCESEIDECLSSLCRNGAACVDMVDGYHCECVEGWTGRFCEEEIVVTHFACSSNQCENNGTCIDTLDSFICQCVSGFTGDRCQTDVNECASSPCVNGDCEDLVGRYECHCPHGINGSRCEIVINDCASSPCQGEFSRCVDEIAGYKCDCPINRSGLHCEILVPRCDNETCKHGGTCDISPDGNVTCACSEGWTGPRCQSPVTTMTTTESTTTTTTTMNACASRPCANNATCVSLIADDFRCECARGWTGLLCNVDANECASEPCMHAGTCVDGVDGFKCMCTEWWQGVTCNVSLSPCDQQPCANEGTCLQIGNSGEYNCTCSAGYTGVQCEDIIDQCKSAPCQYNSTCTGVIGSYYCACAPGTTGSDCSEVVDTCDNSTCLHGGSCSRDRDGGVTCHCDNGYWGIYCEHLEISEPPSYIDEGQSSAILFEGEMNESQALNISEHLRQIVAEHQNTSADVITVTYNITMCTTTNGTTVSTFIFRMHRNGTALPWSTLEDIFGHISTLQFEELLPLPLYYGDDCLSDLTLGASHKTNKTHGNFKWIPIAILLVIVIAAVVYVTVRKFRNRKLWAPDESGKGAILNTESTSNKSVFENPLYDQTQYEPEQVNV